MTTMIILVLMSNDNNENAQDAIFNECTGIEVLIQVDGPERLAPEGDEFRDKCSAAWREEQ